MTVPGFLADPWKRSHVAYDRSPLAMRPAPEFATAEVMVASLYRAIGFTAPVEKAVPAEGRKLDKEIAKASPPNAVHTRLRPETWRTVLHGVLESPKQPNQSSRRFLQLSPLVPDAAIYSGSARLQGNSWNPGEFVRRMIAFGAEDDLEAEAVWRALFDALTVKADDDVWARWLQEEFEKWRRGNFEWRYRPLLEEAGGAAIEGVLPARDRGAIELPARRFVADLRAVISAKGLMTRRQWISLLEAVLRLGSVAHMMWLCDVNYRLWSWVQRVMDDHPADSVDVEGGILSGLSFPIRYGNPATSEVRHAAARYLVARLGINLTLHTLADIGAGVGELRGAAEIKEFLKAVEASRERFTSQNFMHHLSELKDRESRTLACKKGIGSNLSEFARHVLGKRQTASELLRGYDQGFVMAKRGDYSAAPWVVSFGPVAVLAVVHCCLVGARGPRSVKRLIEHVAGYGVDVDLEDASRGELGRQLRMLGLVLDSPDAEAGMLLVPPFVGAGVDVGRAPA